MAAGGLGWGIDGLLFFDGAVVVNEDKGVFVLGVGVALGAFVARAQVALIWRDLSAMDSMGPKQVRVGGWVDRTVGS